MYIGFHVKYPLFLSDFNQIWILSTYFREILKCEVSRKPFQWEPICSMRRDRQMDGKKDGQRDRPDKALSRFSQFWE
jgi:hypothetical protein